MSHTFLWHDYETFGLSAALDAPAQFAAIRTDAQLQPIGAPVNWFCQPPIDALPSPEACLVTGITPQIAHERGVPEPQFAQKILAQMSEPNTISVGYNTLRFDDEVTRHLLWRNFFPPYRREYENGCARWDIIDLVRTAYALRPDGIEWPTDAEGRVSLRLELLSGANQLTHEAAHDALSDVEATIALARLIRTQQPKLFDFALHMRSKQRVMDEIGWPYSTHEAARPLIHISGMYGVERRYCGIIMPLAAHPTNKNELIVWDLSADPTQLLDLSSAAIKERMFTSKDELAAKNLTRLPIKTIHLNQSPMVIRSLKTLNDTQAAACGIDWAIVEQNEAAMHQHHAQLTALNWAEIFAREFGADTRPAEAQLYGGSFVSPKDERLLDAALDAERRPIIAQPALSDARLRELWWRYRARHYPEQLTPPERALWHDWLHDKLLGEHGLDAYNEQLNQLGQAHQDSPKHLAILQALFDWSQQVAAQLEASA